MQLDTSLSSLFYRNNNEACLAFSQSVRFVSVSRQGLANMSPTSQGSDLVQATTSTSIVLSTSLHSGNSLPRGLNPVTSHKPLRACGKVFIMTVVYILYLAFHIPLVF